jgi:hypothetical protein
MCGFYHTENIASGSRRASLQVRVWRYFRATLLGGVMYRGLKGEPTVKKKILIGLCIAVAVFVGIPLIVDMVFPASTSPDEVGHTLGKVANVAKVVLPLAVVALLVHRRFSRNSK